MRLVRETSTAMSYFVAVQFFRPRPIGRSTIPSIVWPFTVPANFKVPKMNLAEKAIFRSVVTVPVSGRSPICPRKVPVSALPFWINVQVADRFSPRIDIFQVPSILGICWETDLGIWAKAKLEDKIDDPEPSRNSQKDLDIVCLMGKRIRYSLSRLNLLNGLVKLLNSIVN